MYKIKIILNFQIKFVCFFSWDDMGKYDIPAMIDTINSNTNQEKIFYIGHSMGTTGFMVMANDRPEYQDKIHLASFLAPVAVGSKYSVAMIFKICPTFCQGHLQNDWVMT